MGPQNCSGNTGGWGWGTLGRSGYSTAWASFRPHRLVSRVRRCAWGNCSRGGRKLLEEDTRTDRQQGVHAQA